MRLRSQLRHQDGGLATEAVFIIPMVFVMFLIMMQFGLWMYANATVDQAAQLAVRRVALIGADNPEAVQNEARNAANALLSTTNGVQVAETVASSDGRFGAVTVTGQPLNVIPFGDFTVRASKQAPLEQFVNLDERN